MGVRLAEREARGGFGWPRDGGGLGAGGGGGGGGEGGGGGAGGGEDGGEVAAVEAVPAKVVAKGWGNARVALVVKED